jgi:GntR family transcriptional regulator
MIHMGRSGIVGGADLAHQPGAERVELAHQFIDRIEGPCLRPIPSEIQLMQQHGVARLTARRAVRVLASEGLVEVVQGGGAYVAERQP